MSLVNTYRRFAFLKCQAAASGSGLQSVWERNRISTTGTSFPVGFPHRDKLLSVGFLVVEEVDGADEQELVDAGLTRKEAAQVIEYLL